MFTGVRQISRTQRESLIMKTIILRADDISAFTSPALLEKVYGRFWQANIPISLAVIPQARGDVRLLDESDKPYDPSIPPKFRGNNTPQKLSENKILCRYLAELARQGLLEICLQGYEATYKEFDSDDETLLSQKIEVGKAELENTFPNVEISTFIAPEDGLSATALQLLIDYGFHVCATSYCLQGTEFDFLNSHSRHDLPNEQHLFCAAESPFKHTLAPESCLSLAELALEENSFLISSSQYWTFYYDWAGNWEAMFQAWNRYVDTLLAIKNVKFTHFSQA